MIQGTRRNHRKLAFAVLLILAAIGGGASSFALAGGSEAHALPRATTDRPDDSPGQPQIHVVYALPSDGTDRSLDVDGTLLRTVTSWNTWLAAQTGGRNFRLDTSGGQLDITFVRLPQTDAQIEATGAYVRDQIERDLHSLGFMQSGKIYAVYYDGRSNWSCGGGSWPPTLPGDVAAIYLHGLFGGPVPCDTNRFGEIGNPQYLEFSMIHEIMHTLGFVPTCAPHQTRLGHVSGPTNDLMYAGDAPWQLPATLDVGHDDYYGANAPGCNDLTNSPLLQSAAVTTTITSPTTPTPRLSVHPASVARGGSVTVSGIGCRAGDLVYLISSPFVGHAFVSHSVATRARSNGSFSRRVSIRRSIHAGRYAITARCGGGNLGVAAHLRVH